VRKFVALLLGVGALASCSVGQDLPAANAAVGAFHQKLNAGDFAGIYDAASPDLKNLSSQADFTQLLSAVHRKLGNYQSGSAGSWNDNVNTTGHFISLTFSAKYERGSADESFVYRVDGAKLALAGYHVSSNALIVN
jgi:hypothetical protein